MTPKSADLPDGSIVANDDRAWTKSGDDSRYPWRDPEGDYTGNNFIDYQMAAGATVLRVGYGEES